MSNQPIIVGNDAVQEAANRLEDLMHQGVNVLSRYQQAAQDIHAPHLFLGQAAGANIMTTDEIQHAQNKLMQKWGTLIDVLRNVGHKYVDVNSQNAAMIQGLASGL